MRYSPALLMLLSVFTRATAQEVTLFAEPAAGGVQYLNQLGTRWRIGAAATAGPLAGVTLSAANVSDARNWATAYAAVAVRGANGLQLVVNPIGAALVSGNDFSAMYPSAQVSVELARGRYRLGTAVRTIRIAGSNNSGTYWTHWVPLRIGYAFGRS